MSAKDRVIKQISTVHLLRDQLTSPGNTVLQSAFPSKGDTTIDVAAITNFADGDVIRIGSGETLELAEINGTPAGNTITVLEPLSRDHPTAEPVVEQYAADLGDVSDGGLTLSWAGESQDIFVATQRLVYATLNGFVSATMEFSFPGTSVHNFAWAVGASPADVKGSGTSAAPYAFTSDGTEFGNESNMSLVVVGTTMDGTIVASELWGVDFDYTGISAAFSRGVHTQLPIRATGNGGVIDNLTPAYLTNGDAVSTDTPTKGKVFDAVTEFGILTDGAGTGAVASGGAAGTNTVTLGVGEGAGFAADEWVQFGANGSGTVEFHQVESVATDTLTMRTFFYRSQVATTAVKGMVETAFAGIGTEGVNLTIGGSVEEIRSATSRIAIGTRPGQAQVSIGAGIIEINEVNFAYALGIAQSEITANRLPITGDNIGITSIDGIYMKGLLLDGTNFRVSGWGNSVDMASVQSILNNQGAITEIPILLKPASGLQLLNWA
jgi:hypothetical protein